MGCPLFRAGSGALLNLVPGPRVLKLRGEAGLVSGPSGQVSEAPNELF
jgi:hypothetical protein